MAQTKPTGQVLQITKLPPYILQELRIYEAKHNMEHAEVFTKAFLLLLANE